MDGFQRLPRITGEELVKALQKAGFEIARRKGSHVQLRKVVEGREITFPVPVHKGKILKLGFAVFDRYDCRYSNPWPRCSCPSRVIGRLAVDGAGLGPVGEGQAEGFVVRGGGSLYTPSR